IRAGAAVQAVVTGPAGYRVGEPVAGAGEGAASGVGEVLELVAERIPFQAGQHRVRAATRSFRDRVARIDEVGVVARATDQGVAARAAVQRIVARGALQRVRELVAVAGEVARAAVGEVLDVAVQRVAGEAGQHRVGAAA